jgi:RimJ/RimL family protein N-acetyltransferase
MIAFRELRRGDLPFLLAVRNVSRAMLHDDSEFALEEAQAWFDKTKPPFFIATSDGIPVGYFRTSNWDEKNHHCYIGLDLHPDFRGKGLAQAAYRVFLDYLFHVRGLNKVVVEVLDINVPAQKLYARAGFSIDGVKRQEVYRNGSYLDSIVMSILKSEFELQSKSK